MHEEVEVSGHCRELRSFLLSKCPQDSHKASSGHKSLFQITLQKPLDWLQRITEDYKVGYSGTGEMAVKA